MNPSVGNGGPSLQRRLLATVLTLVALVWAVATAATWIDTEHEVGELLDAHLTQAASLLVSLPLDDLTRTDLEETPVLHEYQTKSVFQVWHGDQLVVRSASAPLTRLAPPTQRGLAMVSVEGQPWRVFSARGRDPHVVVHVANHDQARADVVTAAMTSVIWPTAVALPLLALAVWWAVRRALRPLVDLGQVVARRNPDDDAPLPLHRVPQEAQPLVLALNRLFARMVAVLQAERRFTADAAHELRTPIAAIRMQAQVAQGATDPAERDDALNATLQGCDRASHLVDQLLQLARLEALTTSGGEGCDLRTVLDWVTGDLSPVARQRHQTVALDVPAEPDRPWPCPVPEGLMVIVLRNLVDNALRYGPDGCRVTLTVCTQPRGGGQLMVEDNGPGMADADLQRLGERFFRVMGNGRPGSGLGWSIVTRVAGLHGLQLQVDRSPAWGGLRVRLNWEETR